LVSVCESKHISNVAAPLAVQAAKQAINRGLQEPDLKKSLKIAREFSLTLLKLVFCTYQRP